MDPNNDRINERSLKIAAVQTSLANGVTELARRDQGFRCPGDDDRFIRIAAPSINSPEDLLLRDENNNPAYILLHDDQNDDMLLPCWKTFSEALADSSGHIQLSIERIQLGRAVLDLLLQSCKTAHLQTLVLGENILDSECIIAVAHILDVNITLEHLWIACNHIGSEHGFNSLMAAVIKHPKLYCLVLQSAGIGEDDAVMASIVPALNYLREIHLNCNLIGTHGAKLISSCLESNPCVEILWLDGNVLNDDDARLFAKSLRTNTNLRRLHLQDNQITSAGLEALCRAVFNSSSLNDIYDSNHTCMIVTGDDALACINFCCAGPGRNKNAKLARALSPSCIRAPCDPFPYDKECTNILYLEGIPLGLMPKVLAFSQIYHGVFCPDYQLNFTFQLLREWHMELPGSSRIEGRNHGSKSRSHERSERGSAGSDSAGSKARSTQEEAVEESEVPKVSVATVDSTGKSEDI